VEGFGPAFITWAQQRYRAVIGLDHWTLSKDPLENAELLASELNRVAPELLEEKRLDVITHSRGGLVARAFCELLPHAGAVKNLIFLGTPNCGTDLANPKNWGAMADLLINLTGVDHARVFGRIAGLLARLAISGGMKKIPGLLAQNPLMAGEESFLKRLQAADADADIRHAVVTAEFEPSPFVPNLKGLWEAAKSAGIDTTIDTFFRDGNDLVVNTRHVWCLGQPPSAAANLPAFLSAERVLAFAPVDTEVVMPKGVHHEVLTGVHHCNLFSQPLAQEKIRGWLEQV
jgi:pimeloyl-ACP methyl ester carboxylesterase